MTGNNTKAQAQKRPSKPNPALKRLDALVGEWDIEVSLPLDQFTIVHGRTSFDWLEGGAFLVMHSDVKRTDFPSVIAVIGRALL